MDITVILLVAFGLYLGCGLIFAVPFVTLGVGKIDPHAARGSWGFRVLIVPGTVLLWPLLARRWLGGDHEPPEENNAHRRAARPASRRSCATPESVPADSRRRIAANTPPPQSDHPAS